MKFCLLATLLYSIANAFSGEMQSFGLAVDRRDVESVINYMTSIPHLVDPTINGNDALYLACDENRADLLKILLDDERIDPTEENNRAFYNVFQNGFTDLVSLFLKDGRVSFTLPALAFFDESSFGNLSSEKINNPLLIDLNDIRRLSTWEVEYVLYVLKDSYSDHYQAMRDTFKLAALQVPDDLLQDKNLENFYFSLDGPKMLIEELKPHFETYLNQFNGSC
jgi:hypothetical protein